MKIIKIVSAISLTVACVFAHAGINERMENMAKSYISIIEGVDKEDIYTVKNMYDGGAIRFVFVSYNGTHSAVIMRDNKIHGHLPKKDINNKMGLLIMKMLKRPPIN